MVYPDFSAGKPPSKRYPTLDQNAALNSQASSLLIDALAGTGKTSTLAIKAADLIQHRGAERILMLAYSEAGLKAIQARLAQHGWHATLQGPDMHLRPAGATP